MVRFAGDVLMCENRKPGFSRTLDAGIRDLANAGPARAVITLERRRKMRSVSRRGAAVAVLAVILSAGEAQAGPRGEALYLQHCAACHQWNGQGIPGFFPPLAGNPLAVSEDPWKIEEHLRRVIFGYHGGLVVGGEVYTGTMPPIGSAGRLSDKELLDLINYQRRAWGHKASLIMLADVARARGVYAPKEDWKTVSKTGDPCRFEYDANRISYGSASRVLVWVRTSVGPGCKATEEGRKTVEKLGKEYAGYEFNADLYEVDCARNIFKLVETLHMTKDGKVIGMVKHKGQEGEIPAGSVIDRVREEVCKRKP